MHSRQTAAVLFACTMFAGCVGPFREDREVQYENVAAARSDDRGWMPAVVPPEAANIRLFYYVDSILTWGCFDMPNGADGLRKQLSELQAQRTKGPVDRGPRPYWILKQWWPTSMASTSVDTYRFAETAKHLLTVGITDDEKRACFHRTYSSERSRGG